MAFYMAVHEPHPCNRENIPTLNLIYCNIKKNYSLGMQVGNFKGFFLIEDMSACNIPGLDASNLIATQPFLGTEITTTKIVYGVTIYGVTFKIMTP